jgi:anti-sigma factor RsiW
MADLDCQGVLDHLPAYLEGEAPAELSAALERHLAGCRNCHVVVDSLRRTIEHYHALPGPALSAAARERLYQALHLADFPITSSEPAHRLGEVWPPKFGRVPMHERRFRGDRAPARERLARLEVDRVIQVGLGLNARSVLDVGTGSACCWAFAARGLEVSGWMSAMIAAAQGFVPAGHFIAPGQARCLTALTWSLWGWSSMKWMMPPKRWRKRSGWAARG